MEEWLKKARAWSITAQIRRAARAGIQLQLNLPPDPRAEARWNIVIQECFRRLKAPRFSEKREPGQEG